MRDIWKLLFGNISVSLKFVPKKKELNIGTPEKEYRFKGCILAIDG